MSAARRERAHAPASDPHWEEAWDLELVAADGTAASLHLGLRPAAGVAWYWACLVVPGLPGPVVVHDREVPLPRTAALEVRSDALWAELVCETPMEHWSIGLEAFGVALDDAAAALDPRGEIGERVAVGLDLEWELDSPPHPAEDEPGATASAYAQFGIVHGTILLGRDELTCEAVGVRRHRWGPHDWWGRAWRQGAFRLGATAVLLDGPAAAVSGWEWEGARPARPIGPVGLDEGAPGSAGLPSTLGITRPGGAPVQARLLAAAPLLLADPGTGRRSRLLRGLYTHAAVPDGEGAPPTDAPLGAALGWHELLVPA